MSEAGPPGSQGATDLDDLEAVTTLDSLDVLGSAERFADQCREGWTIGLAASGLPEGTGVETVLVLGMGGSGIAGEVVGAVAAARLLVPFTTLKGYGPLPEWVGRNTLVVAVSYSGDTEETLEAVEAARARAARIVAVSSGGRLAEMAETSGFAYLRIPGGRQPRASLGWLSMSIMGAMTVMGLLAADVEAELDEAVQVLSEISERCKRSVMGDANEAKVLALRLVGRVPVVYGAQGIGSVAAQRCKTDLNEYAKTPAFYNVIPELNHNEIAGYAELAELTAAGFVTVLLRDSSEHARVSVRFDITRSLVEPRVAAAVEVSSQGKSPTARLLSLILVTQFAAIYLGLAYGRDPGPVEALDELKAELKER